MAHDQHANDVIGNWDALILSDMPASPSGVETLDGAVGSPASAELGSNGLIGSADSLSSGFYVEANSVDMAAPPTGIDRWWNDANGAAAQEIGPPEAPGPAGSLQTLANYLTSPNGAATRYFNVSNTGIGANSGVLYYNVTGFSGRCRRHLGCPQGPGS